MDQTRKMWASAVAVGVIVAGGVSVAAAASAGRLDQARQTRAVIEKSLDQPSQPTPSGQPSGDGLVVTTEVNPNPEDVIGYWTEERLEGANPMPMPEVRQGEFELAE
ncbi:hypothetical protein [Nonomuraea sp. SBT364]|uniref:hypothetical protein n=1 Tax=Nonomuraea sp. SBT364 TaxID=1580530 RepID=UPI000ADE99C6|nr:hypothetical protein [Nonomuraea sp. SBT364]